MSNAIIRYFDLQSKNRPVTAQGHAGGAGHAPVLPQYLAVSAGVIVEPFLRVYIATGTWQFALSAFLGRLAFGLIIGIVILPAVYKSVFDPSKPVVLQLAALFPMGLGWQSLFTSATKIALG